MYTYNPNELRKIDKIPNIEPVAQQAGSLALESIDPAHTLDLLEVDVYVTSELIGLSDIERDLPPYEPIKPQLSSKTVDNTDDLVARYLTEIGKYPLLDRDDEQHLGRYVQRGKKSGRSWKKINTLQKLSMALYHKQSKRVSMPHKILCVATHA